MALTPAHGAAAAMPPTPTPTWDCHRYFKHPGCPGIRASAGHTGGGARGLWRDATHQDEDLHDGLLLELDRIRGDLISGAAVHLWGRSGRHRTSDDEETRRVGE